MLDYSTRKILIKTDLGHGKRKSLDKYRKSIPGKYTYDTYFEK